MKRVLTLTKHLSALAGALAFSLCAQAQLTGTITVPSAGYANLAAAITALNTQGVGAGGVTVNVTAAQTAPAGGYLLGSATLNSGANATTAARPIIINGNSNTVTAFTGTSTTVDGIFQLVGADWVTINALHLTESAANTTNTTRMEWGYALVKQKNTAPFNGCQNNTIKNCNITLNKLNTNSIGIYGGNHIATSTTNLTITAVGDANSYNTFSGNTIANAFNGIEIIGFNNASPYALYDQGNIIGGTTASAGNTIQNFAGSTTGYGVYVNYQNDFQVRKNTIENATGGAAATSIVYGIYVLGAGTNGSVIGNSLNLSTSSTSYQVYASTSDEFLAIDSNSLGFGSTGSGTMYGIYTIGTTKFLQMNANTLDNATIASTGTMYIFYPSTTSQAGGKLTLNDNKIMNLTRASTGSTYCIYQIGSTNADTVSISRNKIANVSANSTFYSIYAYGGASPYPVRLYQYDTLQNIDAGTGLFYGIYGYNMSAGSQISNNFIDSVENGSTLYGIFNSSTNTTGLDLHHNKIRNLHTSSTSGTVYGIYTGGTSIKAYNNNVTDLEGSGSTFGTMYGMFVTTGNGMDVYNNNISDLKSPTISNVAPIYGLYLSSGSDMNIYNNTINLNATSTGANFGATGIYYSSAINSVDIRNNILRINVTPSGTGYTVALRRSFGTNGTPPSNLALTSNSNIYYVPTAANAWFYGEGTSATNMNNAYNLTNDPSFNTPCGLYKTFMTPREGATYTENNLVATGTGVNVFAPMGSSYAKSNSTPTPIVTTDFYGVTRPLLFDAGAVQFTGTSLDAAGPLITYTPILTPTYCAGTPTVTATITDPSGVNVAAGTRPRMYFKKSTEANVFGGANASTFNGWKWVAGVGNGPNFSFTINYSLLTSGLAVNDSIQYFIIAQDNAATPNVGTTIAVYPAGYCPTSVALPAAAGPIVSSPVPPNGYRYLPLPFYGASVGPRTLCLSGDITLSLSEATNGLTVQWQSAPLTGIGYTNLAGKTNPTDTLQNLSTSRLYRAILSCGGVPVFTTLPDTLQVLDPKLLSTTPAGKCGPGVLTLAATAAAGNTISWYTTSTGGAPVATGPSFTTPNITSTTTYYASASAGGAGGKGSISTGTNIGTSGSGTGGMMFEIDAVTPFTIDSVEAAFVTAGMQPFDVYIRSGTHCGFQTNAAGWTLVSTGTVPATTTLGTFALTTPVNIPAGLTGVYFAYNARYTTASGCNTTIATNADMTIRLGSALTGLFGTANNRAFSGSVIYHKGCETPRTPVLASIGATVNATTSAAGPTAICPSDSILLSAQPMAPAYTYQWRRNGIAIPGATATQFKAGIGGDYTVVVATVPGCNNASTAPTVVTVKQVPKTVTPGGPIVFCTGGQDTLYGPVGAGLSYQWLLNGAPVAGANTQRLIINTGGAYRLRVISASLGCADTSVAVNVTVPTTPPAGITTNGFTAVCPNSSLLLSGPAVTGLLYQWSLNGTAINGATGQTYAATTPGSYTLAVDAGPNCKATSAPLALIAGTLPPTAFTPPAPTVLCNGSSVTLQAPVGSYTYQWLNASGAISGASNPTYTLTAPGSFRLKITSTTNGCTDTSAARAIVVAPLPTVSLTPLSAPTLCYSDSIKLTSQSATAQQWQWYRNGNLIPGAVNSEFFAGQISGPYTVRVKDANGCQSNPSNAFNLMAYPIIPAFVTYNSQLTFCAGGATVLTAQTDSSNSVQWVTNGVATPNDTLRFKQVTASGNYSIVVRNNFNCTRVSNVVPVTVLPLPLPQISRTGDILSVNNGPFLTYKWYRNNLLIPGANQSTYRITTSGIYSVQVVDGNTCEGRSEAEAVGALSVKGTTAAGDIRLYPNPTSSLLYVDAPVGVSLTVRDATGRMVATTQQANTIDLSNLADGLYLVYVTNDKGQVLTVEKITKTAGR